MNKELDMAKEVERLVLEGMKFEEAYYTTLEMYKETYPVADQNKLNKHDNKTFNDIISSETDLDNGCIYNIETGETVKEL